MTETWRHIYWLWPVESSEGNDGNCVYSGYVKVYEYSKLNRSQVGLYIDGETSVDYSGESVSLSSGGFPLAIGAEGNDGNRDNSGHFQGYKYLR